jgi:hypothetical protein
MAGSDGSSTPPNDKGVAEHVERIPTREQTSGHPNLHEKSGLHSYNDGEDHEAEPKMSFNRMMSLIAMAFLWTGSQIPVYLFGGVCLLLPNHTMAVGVADIIIRYHLRSIATLEAQTAGSGLSLQTCCLSPQSVLSSVRSRIYLEDAMWLL